MARQWRIAPPYSKELATQMNQDKASIRKALKAQRQQLSPQFCQQAALGFLDQILYSPIINSQQKFAVYLSANNEIDLKPVITALWDYLPVVSQQNDSTLSFAPYSSLTSLQTNLYGILEPAYSTLINPLELEVVFMPLVACDNKGHRLGMGKAYYDKTFATKNQHHRPLLIGCAYQFQCLDSIPTDPWDITLDMLITDQQVYDFRT